jgi:hypothetical protein
MINPNELTPDEERALRANFECHPQVKAMRQQIIKLSKRKDLLGAARLQAKINWYYEEAKRKLLEQAEKKAVSIMEIEQGMSEEEQMDFDTTFVMIFALTDMIETCVMDLDSLIQKQDKSARYEAFDDVRELGNLCKLKVKALDESTNGHFQKLFGMAADDITELVRNKVRALVRKANKESVK